jgi:hypothetical protein
MKTIALIILLIAAFVAMNHCNPGPGDADVRGPARSVTW